MVYYWNNNESGDEYVESTLDTRNNTLKILIVGDTNHYLHEPSVTFLLNTLQSIYKSTTNMNAI